YLQPTKSLLQAHAERAKESTAKNVRSKSLIAKRASLSHQGKESTQLSQNQKREDSSTESFLAHLRFKDFTTLVSEHHSTASTALDVLIALCENTGSKQTTITAFKANMASLNVLEEFIISPEMQNELEWAKLDSTDKTPPLVMLVSELKLIKQTLRDLIQSIEEGAAPLDSFALREVCQKIRRGKLSHLLLPVSSNTRTSNEQMFSSSLKKYHGNDGKPAESSEFGATNRTPMEQDSNERYGDSATLQPDIQTTSVPQASKQLNNSVQGFDPDDIDLFLGNATDCETLKEFGDFALKHSDENLLETVGPNSTDKSFADVRNPKEEIYYSQPNTFVEETPAQSDDSPHEDADEEALKFGDWEQGFDPTTNHFYWFNNVTDERSWSPPDGWPYPLTVLTEDVEDNWQVDEPVETY
ncbi:hypothetical protein LEN26_008466, partial [Aphanomyces euteiches]